MNKLVSPLLEMIPPFTVTVEVELIPPPLLLIARTVTVVDPPSRFGIVTATEGSITFTVVLLFGPIAVTE